MEQYSFSTTEIFALSTYEVRTLADEIRADLACKELLKHFHQDLLSEKQLPPLEAGLRAAGADYFLRDYLIDHCRMNIFHFSARQIKGFAGNWYIISTLEPNLVELENILLGIRDFYLFCSARKLSAPEQHDDIEQVCTDLSYYRQRIDNFHALSGDGFSDWNRLCPDK